MNPAERQTLWRLGLALSVALVGLVLTRHFGWQGVEYTLWYSIVASALLSLGLYMAVYSIDREEAKQQWKVVVIALTFGVLFKFVLIYAATYALTEQWHYVVLSMAVAQIDPLAIAVLSTGQRMTAKARAVLNMWASFDDPLTAVLTPLTLAIATQVAGRRLASGENWLGILLELAPFILVLLLVGWAAWRRRMGRTGQKTLRKLAERLPWAHSQWMQTIAAAVGWVLTALTRLFSAIAILAWYIRPAWLGGRWLIILTNVSLYGSTFMLGILLAHGVDWYGGLVLGVSTYVSQIAAAWLVWLMARAVGTRFSARDTWQIAISQHNGVTAIVLALVLEPSIPGSVAAISLAIVVINLLYFGVNWAYDRFVGPEMLIEEG